MSASGDGAAPGQAPGSGPVTDAARPGRASRLLVRTVAFYPAAWRRQYGAEFKALLAETRPTPRVILDVLAAAADAHLNPTTPARRWPPMVERLRTSELAVFVGWVAFVVAGIGFQKMTEDVPFRSVASGQPAIRIAFDIVAAGAVVALLGVLVAGVPIAWAILRSAIRTHRWRQLALLAVPGLSLAGGLGVLFILLKAAAEPVPNRALVALLTFVTLLVGALASTVAVSVAAIHGDVDPALYRRAVGPGMLVAAAMVVVLAAVVTWGVALLLTWPELFWGDMGVVSTSTAVSWLVIVVVMAAGTFVAAWSAASARRHLRA